MTDINLKSLLLRLEREKGLVNTWHGRCYEIACAAARAIGNDAEAVYGHYYGPVNPIGYWGDRAGLPWQPHGWVRLSDGRTLDPTRWSFETKEPYIWLGDNNGDYDEGGNRIRSLEMIVKPMPDDTVATPIEQASGESPEKLELELPDEAMVHIASLCGLEQPVCFFTRMQCLWLANAALSELQPYAQEIFQALEKAGLKAYIPIDNRKLVLGSYS